MLSTEQSMLTPGPVRAIRACLHKSSSLGKECLGPFTFRTPNGMALRRMVAALADAISRWKSYTTPLNWILSVNLDSYTAGSRKRLGAEARSNYRPKHSRQDQARLTVRCDHCTAVAGNEGFKSHLCCYLVVCPHSGEVNGEVRLTF